MITLKKLEKIQLSFNELGYLSAKMLYMIYGISGQSRMIRMICLTIWFLFAAVFILFWMIFLH